MSSLRPQSAAALTAHRREAIRLAKSQEKAVYDRCVRANQDVPGYAFDELIGKGSFGRVYKGRQKSTSKIVAIKVLDIDDADFQAFGDQKDEQIRDFNREIHILRQAQDSGAENLNQMIEALPVYSQLWLICEYCPGGSVKTLMRATNDRLAEKYLIVVARELGKALKGLHEAGIMHRDVKAANVLIHENGGLQLCDFGVAATLEGSKDKRRTFIGTLHWMPPELWDDSPEYSDEVDVWGYGCTIYECALGRPPNADLRERQQLKMRMRRLKQSISLPEKEHFSDGLRSLIQFTLNPDAASRPSMYDVLQHTYLTETEQTHPTSSLTELVQHYYGWLFSGGQRISLFMPGGAAAASELDEDPDLPAPDEWNFSMTQDFEKRVSAILEIPDLSDASWIDDHEGDATPKQPKSLQPTPQKDFTAVQQVNFERRVQRGEGLANLFDQAKPAYEYKTKTDFVPVQAERRISDLPFRAMAEERPSSIASNVIDLGDFDSDDYAVAAPISSDNHIQTVYAGTPMKEETGFRLADAATIRAKRADSKGPRDPTSLAIRRSSGLEEPDVPGGVATQDFALEHDEWTIKDHKQTTEDTTETTPIANAGRSTARQTMEWSFASAMNELTPSSDSQSEPSEFSAPIIDVTEATVKSGQASKAMKHATLDWSFSDAMAEVTDTDQEDIVGTLKTITPRRPAPMLRTMTQPITQHEVQDAYEEVLPGRPDTALSFTYSETSQSSTDFDPFALERHNEMDDAIKTELDEMDASSFYATRGQTMTGISLDGPGPEDDSFTHILETSPAPRTYMNGNVSRQTSQEDFPAYTITAANNSRMGHYRGNGAHTSRNSATSVSSRSSAGTNNLNPLGPNTVDLLPSHERGPSNTSTSSTGTTGTRVSQLGSIMIGFPDPKPPSFAALSRDANAETVERELERLLGDFQGALGVAGDMLSEELRGRGRTRKGRNVNGFGPILGSEEEESEGDGDTGD